MNRNITSSIAMRAMTYYYVEVYPNFLNFTTTLAQTRKSSKQILKLKKEAPETEN